MQNTELSDSKNNDANETSVQFFERSHISFLPNSMFPAFQELILFQSIFTGLEAYQGLKQESWVMRNDSVINISVMREQKV